MRPATGNSRGGEYHKAVQHKHLVGAGLTVWFEEYLEAYPKARDPKEKMVLIDALIHKYHWELEGWYTRPGAPDLIDGKQHELLDFLRELNYGDRSTHGLTETKADWLAKVRKSEERYRTKASESRRNKADKEKRKELKKRVRQQQLVERKRRGNT